MLAIQCWAKTVPDVEWILGRGRIESGWTDEQRFLTKHDVDAFTLTKPLSMPRADSVSALVNSAALRLAGITKKTAVPATDILNAKVFMAMVGGTIAYEGRTAP